MTFAKTDELSLDRITKLNTDRGPPASVSSGLSRLTTPTPNKGGSLPLSRPSLPPSFLSSLLSASPPPPSPSHASVLECSLYVPRLRGLKTALSVSLHNSFCLSLSVCLSLCLSQQARRPSVCRLQPDRPSAQAPLTCTAIGQKARRLQSSCQGMFARHGFSHDCLRVYQGRKLARIQAKKGASARTTPLTGLP